MRYLSAILTIIFVELMFVMAVVGTTPHQRLVDLLTDIKISVDRLEHKTPYPDGSR